MTMTHTAHGFRYMDFERELAPLIRRALAGSPDPLFERALSRAGDLRDPEHGSTLTQGAIRGAARKGDIEFVAEACLTSFYDPDEDVGVGDDFIEMSRELSRVDPDLASFLLGTPLTSGSRTFDPGRMGTYFCSPADVRRKRAQLDRIAALGIHAHRLRRLVDAGLAAGGRYITF